jgi:hypothetical protein
LHPDIGLRESLEIIDADPASLMRDAESESGRGASLADREAGDAYHGKQSLFPGETQSD